MPSSKDTNMKKLTTTLFALLLLSTGCTTIYAPGGEGYRVSRSQWTVVNNTGSLLDIYMDGVLVSRGMETGQVFPVGIAMFRPETIIVVIGHTKSGEYLGTDTHRFFYQEPDSWVVTSIYKPREPR